MPQLLGMALRWALLPFLTILAVAMANGFWHAARLNGLGVASLRHPLALACIAGITFRIAFRYLMGRIHKDDPFEFMDTLEHELTHALVGYLTLAPPQSLSASLKTGGEVQLQGSNPFAALAPYFLPLWCTMLMLMGILVQPGMQASWNTFLFFMLGLFIYRLSREFRWRQTDLHIYGFLFSTISVFILLLLGLGIVLKVRGLLPLHWFGDSLSNAWHSLPQIWTWTTHHLPR